MMINPIHQRVAQDTVCLLYALDSEQIVFMHRVTTLGDLPPLSKEDIEAEARRSMDLTMKQFDERSPDGLGALFVTPEDFLPGRAYVVDGRTGKLTERKRPDSKSTAG